MSSEEGEIKAGVEQAAQESQALIAQSDNSSDTQHTLLNLTQGGRAREPHSPPPVLCCVFRSNWLKALQVSLAAPTGSKDAAVRDQAAASVAACLVAIKDADVAKVIAELTDEQRSELTQQHNEREGEGNQLIG